MISKKTAWVAFPPLLIPSIAKYIGPEPALGFSTIAVRSKVPQWAHKEHYKHWLNIEGCWQTKELVTQVTPGLIQFALRQYRRDLRTLVYLFTGHNTLSRHLTIMRMVNDPLCPLCKEEEETSLHFLCKSCATANIRRLHIGIYFFRNLATWNRHTGILSWGLQKPPRNFNNQLVYQGQRIGPDRRPQRQTV